MRARADRVIAEGRSIPAPRAAAEPAEVTPWSNPLRWYLAALLLGLVLSLLEGYPLLKFQAQRLAELLPALGLLAWCYRRQSAAFFAAPVLSGWYGLGLVGFAAAALLAGARGVIPWISLGFVGLVLLQFALLALLQPAWQRYGADTIRVLALFAVAVLGIDLGIWLLAHAFAITPYSWVLRPLPGGGLAEAPYLLMNSRWANQLAVLLVWSALPLLAQLQTGVIQHRRWFWWLICAAVPLLALAQIVLNQGDGAFAAVAAGVALLLIRAWRCGCEGQAEQRRLMLTAALLLIGAAGLAVLAAWAIDGGGFIGQLVQRNAEQLAPAAPDAKRRIVLWPAYLRAWWASPWLGVGIPPTTSGWGCCTGPACSAPAVRCCWARGLCRGAGPRLVRA